jgi:uncharacterized phage protein (TIGR01671 family)
MKGNQGVERKFRVWYKNRMWYDGFVCWPDGTIIGMETTGECNGMGDHVFYRVTTYYDDISPVMMLSTGLKDAFMKEIWEGDIVRYAESYGVKMPHKEIVFSGGCFIYDNIGGYLEEYVKDHAECIEVIGNKYENAELLSDK